MPEFPQVAFGVGKVGCAPSPCLAFGWFCERKSLSRERLVFGIHIVNADA